LIDLTKTKRVGLLAPCLARAAAPEVIRGAARALTRAGLEVDLPKNFTCCGQPALTAGRPDAARRLARHTLRVLDGPGVYVIPSASCAATIRLNYPALFRDLPALAERARRLGERVFELTEFLTLTGRLDLGARLDLTAVYHQSCHLHNHLGVGDGPQEALARVKGLKILPLDRAEQCCGFGGQFSLDFPAVSGSILGDKLDCIQASGAEAVIVGDVGCKLNIAGGLSRRGLKVRTLHLAEVLGGGGR